MWIENLWEAVKGLLVPRYRHGSWRLDIDRKEYSVPAKFNAGQSIKVSVMVVRNRTDSDVDKVSIRSNGAKNRFSPTACEIEASFANQTTDDCSELTIPTFPAHSTLTIFFTQNPWSSNDKLFVKGKAYSRADERLGSMIARLDNFYWQELVIPTFGFFALVALVAIIGYGIGVQRGEILVEEKIRRLATATSRVGGAVALWDFDAAHDQFRIEGAIQGHPGICPKLDLLLLNDVKSYEELKLKSHVVTCISSFY